MLRAVNTCTDIGEPTDWRKPAGMAAVLVALVLAAYGPALRGQFVWDDRLLIDGNPLATGEFNLWTVWFQTDFPLSTAFLWLQSRLWGVNTAAYHCVNVALHAANCLLLWRVLARAGIRGAWIGAGVFAVHPLCVASVAWISETKNTLSLLLFLLSLRWFIMCRPANGDSVTQWPDNDAANTRARPAGNDSDAVTSRSALFYYLAALTAFVLSLLAKTSTVMLPVVLLAWAWWKQGRITRNHALITVPFFVLSIVFGLMSVWFQQNQAMGGVAVQTEGLPERLALAGHAVWFYLGKAFLPVKLSLMYPRWELNGLTPASVLPSAALCGLACVFWRARNTWGRHALFALVFFVANLFPALGIFDMYFLAISRVSDHFVYISLIAVAATAGAVLNLLPRPGAIRTVTVVMMVGLGCLTFQRATVFASEETLWTDTLARNPNAWPAHNNLGVIRAERGDIQGAMKSFEASLKLNPRNAKAHVNLARAKDLRGEWSEAEPHFRTALEINPRDADAHRFLAAALAKQGRASEAIEHLSASLQSRPDTEVRFELAGLLRQTGRTRDAMEQLRKILSVKPDSADALSNLAWMLATTPDAAQRNGDEAVPLAQRACRLTDMQNARMVGTLAAAYAEAGDFGKAVVMAELAVNLASASGNSEFAAANLQLLQLYRSGKPYHEQPPQP